MFDTTMHGTAGDLADVRRVLVCAGRPGHPAAEAVQRSLGASGMAVHRCDKANVASAVRAVGPVDLLIVVGDPRHAAAAAVEHGLPVVTVKDDALPVDLDLLADELHGAAVAVHSLLVVRLDKRPAKLALAECVVTQHGSGEVLEVEIAGRDRRPSRVPALRVANADPFRLLEDRRCQHDGPPSTLGLCWTADEPAADVMIEPDVEISVSPRSGSAKVEVSVDRGRLQGIAERVRIGPARLIQVVTPR